MGNIRDTLATVSRGKKPSKAAAQDTLASLAARHRNDPETFNALADLYAWFMPALPAKPKTDWQWVCRAVAKDDGRAYLNYVYVDEQWVTGCDGHRMHRYPNRDGLTPGYYLAGGERVTDMTDTYPDVERIIPRKDTEALIVDFNTAEREDFGKGIHATLLHGIKGDVWVNDRYLLDAIGGDKGPFTVQTAQGPMGGKALFMHGERQAVVMGMQV